MNSTQKKTCDRLWQIKVTEGGRCTFPGCSKDGNEGHHVFKRRYLNTRWDVRNGRCLCREHHMWADTHPIGYEGIIINEIGSYEYENIRIQAQMLVKQFYEEIRRELK